MTTSTALVLPPASPTNGMPANAMPTACNHVAAPADAHASTQWLPLLAAGWLLVLCSLAGAADIDELPTAAERAALPADGGEHFNRLIHSASPYLLQHATNPVDWYEWGDEAFAKARAENKPIFLSVGYSTCHWCHVMGRESFMNQAVADVLNRHFVPVKLDREERPDVDHVYMTFVQATTGHGGWPMSVWMTPDREPIVGGTYFPREQFLVALARIDELWQQDSENLRQRASFIAGELARMTAGSPADGAVPGVELVHTAVAGFAAQFDQADAGFGNAPKFPRPAIFELLFTHHARGGEHAQQALDMSVATLREMARGGMYDHLGGGFHRYSVDGEWHVPHFEKMLYDQGQLLASYADAVQLLPADHPDRDDFITVINQTVAYLKRDMRHAEGGLFSAEDADSKRADGSIGEGVFYVWAADEVAMVLADDADALRAATDEWGIGASGNVDPASDPHHEFDDMNVLTRRLANGASMPDQEALERARAALFAYRGTRHRPHLDDKILTAWNGLAISGLARVAEVLNHADALALANAAAAFINQHLYDADTQTLFRSWRDGQLSGPGFAVDYAFLIQGLLDLHRVGGDIQHLVWARALQAEMDERFGDPEAGAWFDHDGVDPTVLLRTKEQYDGAEPAATSVAVRNLLRLAELYDDSALREQARRALDGATQAIERSPVAAPILMAGLDAWHQGVQRLILVPGSDPAELAALQAVARAHHAPHRIQVVLDEAHRAVLASEQPFLAAMTAVDGKATAYLCEGTVCQAPTNDPAVLAAQLSAQLPAD